MKNRNKFNKAIDKAEDTYKKVEDRYSKTVVGKIDKKIDDAFFDFIDKIFGW